MFYSCESLTPEAASPPSESEGEQRPGLHLEDVVDDGPPGQRDVGDDGADGHALHPLGLAPRVEYLRVSAHRPEGVVLGLLELVEQVAGVDLARGVAQRVQILVRIRPEQGCNFLKVSFTEVCRSG